MTALAVELCACGHAPRMHERDGDAESGRGVCAQRSCGCTEFRPGSVDVEPAPPVGHVVFVASEPVEEPDTVPAVSFPCPVCGKGFPSPQGRGGHRAKAHPGSMAIKIGADAGSSSPEPDRPAGVGGAVVAPLAAAPPISTPVEVHRGVVLIGLVRALQAVMTADADAVVEMALDIQRYMDDRGWRVIDGGPR